MARPRWVIHPDAVEYASTSVELARVQTEGRTLTGYASAFNYPIEGPNQTTYVMAGAFAKTLKENADAVQMLFNHGQDPAFGMLPIGRWVEMHEDKIGLRVRGELSNAPLVENVRAGLESGALRHMSIMFETTKEEFSDDRSERYIQEVKLFEAGPVPFPANRGAVAMLHSTWPPPDLETFSEQHWDGAAAMRMCSSAAEFRKIAFERNNDSDPDTAAHWALPHHMGPSAGADPQGVAAALAALHGGRGGAPDLKMSLDSVESHLQGHQAETSSAGDRGEDARIPDEDRLTRAIHRSQYLEALERADADFMRRLRILEGR